GHQEVERVLVAGVEVEVDLAEEHEDPHRDPQRDDEALAPPQRELRLHLDLGADAPRSHLSPLPGRAETEPSDPGRPSALGSCAAPAPAAPPAPPAGHGGLVLLA